MCGIVGYAGRRPAEDGVVERLRRMEYRGYDSARIACELATIRGHDVDQPRNLANSVTVE